jgi:hypothetical protein
MSALSARSGITERHPPVAIRRIVHRTRGAGHGPITRLVSPSDLGELIKSSLRLSPTSGRRWHCAWAAIRRR